MELARLAVPARDWPLVGRSDELRLLGELLDRGDAAGVVLAGAAGAGKSRLAREIAAEAESRGLATAWIVASGSAAAIPFGAFAPLLPVGRGASDLLAALQSGATALAALGGGRRPVLVVDDGHLLDDASAALVHRVALDGSVFVVLTVRTGAAAPDPIVALWKDGTAERLELSGLSPEETAALAAVALGGVVDAPAARALFVSSQGSPLYLRELLLGALESATLVNQQGVWTLRGTLGAPRRLAELLELRLADLEPADLAVMEALTLAHTLGLSALSGIAGSSGDQLERLERLELIQVGVDWRRRPVRLSHPLYGELLRAAMPASRALALGDELADLLEETGARRRGDVLRLAKWRVDTGRPLGGELLHEAAREAYYGGDADLAQRLARAAVAAQAGVDAGLLLGQLLDEAGRHEEAEALFAGLDHAQIDDGRRTAAATARSDNLFFGLGRAEEALGALRAADRDGLDSALSATLRTNAAWLVLHRGDADAAVEATEPLLRAVGAEIRVGVGVVAASALAVAGRTRDAVAAAEQAVDAERPAAYPHVGRHDDFPRLARAAALLEAGRLDEAAAIAQTGYEASLTGGAPFRRARWAFLAGRVALAQGLVRTAAASFAEGAALQRRLRQHGLLRWNLGGLALASALAGDVDAAEAALGEADAAAGRPERLFDSVVGQARGWAAVARGETAEGLAHLEAAAGLAERQGLLALASAGLHDLARLGRAADASARLVRLAEASDGDFIVARAAHAAALTAADADALVECADAFERVGAVLDAADAAAVAGALLADAGEARRAQAQRHRAAALAARCEGARTPALSTLGDVSRLTRREREVAGLAAQGLSSREIADRLVISARTVDKHLERAFAKLGVSGRDVLRNVLGVLALD